MSLITFLRNRRTREKSYSHVLVGHPYGTYALGSDMEKFLNLYVENTREDDIHYVAEHPMQESPVLVDVDLSVKKSHIEDDLKTRSHIYTLNQCKEVISVYQDTLKEIVQDLNDDALTCVLLEKPYYERDINGEPYIKNGFHLHFPKLFLDRKAQEVYLIPIAQDKLKHTFANLEVKEPVDTNSVNVPWLMYKSRKPNCKPYHATKCFDSTCKEIEFEDGLGDYDLPDFTKKNKGSKRINCAGRVHELMARILSIFLYDRTDYYYKTKPSISTPLLKEYELVRSRRREYDQLTVDETLIEAQKLLDMFSSKRADDRADWLAVGFCLWNITQGDNEGLEMWLMFSEQSEKYREAECIYNWKNMRENKYTIGTLRYFAKIDNPERYSEHVKLKGKSLLKEALNGCHNDIARILHNEYGNEFVCTSISNKTWYQFKNHIWVESDKGTCLRKRISCPNGIVIKQLTDCMKSLADSMGEDDNDAKESQKNMKRIGDIIRNCKSSPCKNNVMIECAEVFYSGDFINFLNKDPNIIAFKNGVYDFTHNIFRDGKPEDYLSVTLPIDYIDYGSVNHPKVIEVVDFFRKIFPDVSIRDYFIEQVCQVFVGGNHDKVVLFWTGEGNNGKTITQTLMEKMLGPLYCIKLGTQVLTGKKIGAGAANPEMARAGNGVRWAVMEEPNPDEEINCGALKSLTGNDTFWARDLFEKGKATKEITPMFKLHVICNNLMPMRNPDPATWNRVRVIPFESTFDTQVPDTPEEQMAQKRFPMDKHFINKIPDLVQPLAWFLISKWKTCNRLEKFIPEKVSAATDGYKRKNDLYRQFMDECVFTLQGSKLTPFVLYSNFKDWYREEYPGQNIPNKSSVVTKFVSLWGPLLENKYWLGKTCDQQD